MAARQKTTAPKPEPVADMSATMFSPAPKQRAGDAIELNPLRNKVVALKVFAHTLVETQKWGERGMSQVLIVAEGSPVPLEGVLFQSYFQNLPLDQWFIGRIVKIESKDRTQWLMSSDKLPPKTVQALAAIVSGLTDE